MIVGDHSAFAIESGITQAYDRVSQRALGFFVIHLGGRHYGKRSPDSTMLGCAFDEVEKRLADRGTARTVRQETLEAVQRAGLIDDRRFAASRAALLAQRGAGDLLIADDLERHGVSVDTARIAMGELEPEPARAAALIEARGRSPKTARFLAAKGFSDESLEALVADLGAEAIG